MWVWRGLAAAVVAAATELITNLVTNQLSPALGVRWACWGQRATASDSPMVIPVGRDVYISDSYLRSRGP